jgi:serine/threonine-protein kinase
MFPQIFGKYVLEREIAAGGMARVYLATLRGAVGFEKRLVVKQIRAELASDEAFVKRFVEEAKTAVELSHPNIVPVYELGVEQGVYYIAMELCEGVPLAELLELTGPLSPEEGAYVGIEISRALDYAHRRAGIVHRDVTQRNVMIDAEGAVRLIDFGIAAPVAEDGADPGERAEVFGSPGHMPPEQMEGRPLSPATDVFAVAVLLIEAWTGRPPYRRSTPADARKAMLSKPPPLSERVAELAPLDALIAKSLAFDASERPVSPEELSRPLREFVRRADLGDIARRLGERVRQASEKATQSEAWRPGDGLSGTAAPETPRADGPIETRTFAARDDLAEWAQGREIADAPATRKLESEPPPPSSATLKSGEAEAERGSEPEVGSITTSGTKREGGGGWRVALLAAAALGLAVWGGARMLRERPAPAPAPASSPAPEPAPPPRSSQAPSVPSATASVEPAPSAEPPRRPTPPAAASVPASGPCRLSVGSVPAGAAVTVGGRSGQTPLRLELPCGSHAVVVQHAALNDRASVPVTLVSGKTTNVLIDWGSGVRKTSVW